MPPPKQPTFNSRRRIAHHCIGLAGSIAGHAHTASVASTMEACTIPDAVHALERDLREIFGGRLRVGRRVRPGGGRRRRPRSRAHGAPHGGSDPAHTLAIVDALTRRRSARVRGARRGVARRRTRHAAAARRPRVRAIARRVSARVRRHPRRPRGRVRAQSVRRPDRRRGRPAARVRGAGAQPPAAPARGLSRNARAQRRARRADRPLGGAVCGAVEERRAARRSGRRATRRPPAGTPNAASMSPAASSPASSRWPTSARSRRRMPTRLFPPLSRRRRAAGRVRRRMERTVIVVRDQDRGSVGSGRSVWDHGP